MINPTDSAAIAAIYATSNAPSPNVYSTLFATHVSVIGTIRITVWEGMLHERFGCTGAVIDIGLANTVFNVGIFRDMLGIAPSQL